MIFIPPLAWIGLLVSATVYKWNGSDCAPDMATFQKTSQGPQKSMMTASRESTKATGILPLAGGWSGFAVTLSVAPAITEAAEDLLYN